MLFYDEAFFRRESTVTRGWYPKGQKSEVSCPVTFDRVGVCGAVSPRPGSLFSLLFDGFDSDTFIYFLSWLLKESTIDKKIILILDNATSHKSKKVKEYVAEHEDRIELLYLPPYSPDLNPIERVWKDLRYQVTHNVFCKTLDDLEKAVASYLKRLVEPNENLTTLCCIK